MLGLYEVRDWLKSLGVGEHFYIGKLDAKKDKAVGVYQRKTTGKPRVALGGLVQTKYAVKAVSVMLHWNTNSRETEKAAAMLFEKLQQAENIVIGETKVNYLSLEVSEPVDVGSDDKGIYERVIWFDLYYER